MRWGLIGYCLVSAAVLSECVSGFIAETLGEVVACRSVLTTVCTIARPCILSCEWRLIRTGTDHPFFPPLGQHETEWLSVKTNYQAIKEAFGEDQKAADDILGGNAIRILKLDK